MSAIWRISLSNLSRNLLEATELANVLQEVSSSIQVTGLTSSQSARTSSSASGTPTQLSTRERIRNALPLPIGAATVPWEQLVAVVSSDALQEPPNPFKGDKQPQLVEVNTGGTVFFLFFRLTKEQYLQQLQLLQQRQPLNQQQEGQAQGSQSTDNHHTASSADPDTRSLTKASQVLSTGNSATETPAMATIEKPAPFAAASTDAHHSECLLSKMPLMASMASQVAETGALIREGVVVLKVGFNRLAMQAEQFANELTRHLGIAAPDCRIVRQVGSTAVEWNAAMSSVYRLVNCSNTNQSSSSSTGGGAANVSSGGCGGCVGCLTSGGAGELLAELSHLPCFLMMEYVEGDRLADSGHALQGQHLGVLLEDVGCLFLLDMLLGNADRMPCRRLGWRGNHNNLLYGAPGTRHEGRPVAIDSCVARRPPAQKASSEDAAVEQLAQLLLSVPEVSRSLLQQLLGNIKRERQGKVSRLSTCNSLQLSAENSGVEPVITAALTSAAAAAHRDGDGGDKADLSLEQCVHHHQQQLCRAATLSLRPDFINREQSDPHGLHFSDADVARFQTGLRKCLTGVLQIKGLLEMVSSKAAEWVAEFVADVVRLNPAVLPSPTGTAGGGPAVGPAFSPSRSPRPSPRPSMRSSLTSSLQATGNGTSNNSSSSETNLAEEQQLSEQLHRSSHSSSKHSTILTNCAAAGIATQQTVNCTDSCLLTLPPWAARASGTAMQGMSAAGAVEDHCTDSEQAAPVEPLAAGSVLSCAGDVSNSNSSSSSRDTQGSITGVGGASGIPRSTGNSPVGKALLAKRAVSHLGFASIKAAICSGSAAVNASGSSPCIDHNTTPLASSPTNHLAVPAPPLSVVETAVAAALSPRANRAQAQALAGVFGVGSSMGSDGGIGLNSINSIAPHKASCARRVTWGSVGDGERASKVSPCDLFSTPSSSAPGPAHTHSSHSHRASSSTGIHWSQRIPPSSNSGSITSMAPHSVSNGGPSGAYSSSISMTGPQHTANSCPVGSQQLSRHSSFPASPGNDTAVAVGLMPVQQHSTSSSLQVLASIQLDATLASIKHEARHDGALAERMAHWKAVFREKGAELSEAIASWQTRHHLAAVLSTGFLDGSHPIVDVYELGVRLQHMLRRLTALAAGALVQAPTCVLPGLFLGNAVAADSHHLLQYLGVTHVVNAAQELQVEAAPGLFQMYRVAIRDEEEEDVSRHFHYVQTWIDAALSSGGAVLVHCHEGKSRSVALLLAYLMISKGCTLKSAMELIKSVRPAASPNAGFMNQLMALDLELHGAASMCRKELPRAKPEVRVCSICGKPTGVSSKSLDMHVRRAHGKQAVAPAAQGTALAALQGLQGPPMQHR